MVGCALLGPAFLFSPHLFSEDRIQNNLSFFSCLFFEINQLLIIFEILFIAAWSDADILKLTIIDHHVPNSSITKEK